MYCPSSTQGERFDEVIYCVCHNLDSAEMFAKEFIQHGPVDLKMP